MNPNAWYGCMRDLRDFRDRIGGRRIFTLPSEVDLRHLFPPVLDQGPAGTCVAHAVTTAARYHIIRRATTYDFEMSRLQLYWDGRSLNGTERSDAGMTIRNAIKSLARKGIGHEELWPYDISRFDVQPPIEVYEDATQYLALKYHRVPIDRWAIRSVLAAGDPVIIGLSIYESFESEEVARTGVVSMPNTNERMVGAHCMLLSGYGQQTGYYTARNSWGDDWGRAGDCLIPETYIESPKLGADYWHLDLVGSEAELKVGRA